jgi:hypothetical protein
MTALHQTEVVGWVQYLGPGIRKPIAKAAQELPDSPRSNRRPPILPFFQHLHAVHVVHSISERTEEVRVLPSSACLSLTREAAGDNGVWTIEMKEMHCDWRTDKPRVPAMGRCSFDPPNRFSTKIPRPSHNGSRTTADNPLSPEGDGSDDGRYIGCERSRHGGIYGKC